MMFKARSRPFKLLRSLAVEDARGSVDGFCCRVAVAARTDGGALFSPFFQDY